MWMSHSYLWMWMWMWDLGRWTFTPTFTEWESGCEVPWRKWFHGFFDWYPFLMIFAPFERGDRELSIGAKIIKNGSILRKLWDNRKRIVCHPYWRWVPHRIHLTFTFMNVNVTFIFTFTFECDIHIHEPPWSWQGFSCRVIDKWFSGWNSVNIHK